MITRSVIIANSQVATVATRVGWILCIIPHPTTTPATHHCIKHKFHIRKLTQVGLSKVILEFSYKLFF